MAQLWFAGLEIMLDVTRALERALPGNDDGGDDIRQELDDDFNCMLKAIAHISVVISRF